MIVDMVEMVETVHGVRPRYLFGGGVSFVHITQHTYLRSVINFNTGMRNNEYVTAEHIDLPSKL